MICAGCGRITQLSFAGPYRLVKCRVCGPWTHHEVRQAQAEAMRRNGVIPVRTAQGEALGGCGCLGPRLVPK